MRIVRDKIFVDPSDTNGPVSYALSNKVVLMGTGDAKKIAIVESDDEAILINNSDCGGASTIEPDGVPVARHLGMTNALLYGGSVRSFEPAAIELTINVPLVTWWLPYNEHSMVCGTVVSIDTAPLPEPDGSGPDVVLEPEDSGPPPTPGPYDPPCFDPDRGYSEVVGYWIESEQWCGPHYNSRWSLNPDTSLNTVMIDVTEDGLLVGCFGSDHCK